MPLDQHARIVLALGQAQDLFSHPSSLLEVAHVNIKAGQSSQNGKKLGDLSLPLTEIEGAGEASSTSGVQPLMAISALARLIRNIISCCARSGVDGVETRTFSKSP